MPAATMSPERVLLVVMVTIALLPWAAMASTEYWVGDTDGWRPGYNYTQWTTGKEFRVGDTLVFNYTKGKHNVYNVTGTDFQNCTVSSNSLLRDTGDDNITLKTEGKKWYICGVKDHCKKEQKLVITVLPESAGSPTPAPPSGGVQLAFPRVALVAVAAAVAAIAGL